MAAGRAGRGLNENLARECLELHTVSPASGYTQTDVTEFARVLTGWSIERQQNPLGFRFRPNLAEPGDKTVLGRRFPEGQAGGQMALQYLADHPATHRHLATKLVRHFVDDAPPQDAVRRVEGVLRDTRGNLGAAAMEVTRLPGAWAPLTKIRTPQEFILAAFRAADIARDRRPNLFQLMAGARTAPVRGHRAYRLVRHGGGVGRAGGAAAPGGLGLRLRQPAGPAGADAAGRRRPGPAAVRLDRHRDPPRRLPPRRAHPTDRLPRIPKALTMIPHDTDRPMLSRRGALLGLGAAVSLGRVSLAMAAAPTDRRLVVVILRGALDGLAAVIPYGDPALASQRAALLPGGPGQPGGMLDLGGFFALHPALTGLHAMYAQGQVLPVHAVAGHVRTRSHFEAQDLMESGADQRMTSGWLNRAVAALPRASASGSETALSVGISTPLLLRGPAPVGAYAPQSFSQPAPDLYARLVAMHARDPVTGPALRQGLGERGFTTAQLAGHQPDAQGGARYAFATLAGTAGRLMAAPTGPRIAAMELGGWDTHAGQAQRLNQPLRQLDDGLVALRDGLGDAWRQTAVLVMTEFGRTVHVNGTGGTDHGTGTVAFVLGGAVAGGRVRADWPGLSDGRLLDGRDLQPSMDLRSLAKGLLAAHLGLAPASVLAAFPGSEQVAPASGLVRA